MADERTRRLGTCVARWPECAPDQYAPRCCRFPKSCSCTVYDPERVKDEELEPMTASPTASRCTYCGTTLDVQGREAESGGWQHHYMDRCREFVKAASMAKDKELAALRARAEKAEQFTAYVRGFLGSPPDREPTVADLGAEHSRIAAEMASLRARAERYREALEEIANWRGFVMTVEGRVEADERMREIARGALETPKGREP